MADSDVTVRPAQAGQGANDAYVYVGGLQIIISVSDAGVGQDSVPAITFPVSDLGSGIEASQISLPVSDVGAGAELPVTPILSVQDAGSGLEATPSIAVTFQESGTGSESRTLSASFQVSDVGVSQDIFGKQFPVSDAGMFGDRFAIRILRKGRLQYTVRLVVTENVFDPSVFDPYSYE
jgi:hypothetical protein